MKHNIFNTLLITLFVSVLTACSTANTKVGGLFDLDTDFKLSVIADRDLNPDDADIPSPVIIRMYELKSTKLFKNANFIDLYERDTEVLGKSMVVKQALKAIKPNEKNERSFVLNKDTAYIGLYVEFLQYENAKYKVTLPVEQTNVVSSSATVQLSGNRIIVLQ